eukprot:1144805-Pelagomonas_calceolata.AAC.2
MVSEYVIKEELSHALNIHAGKGGSHMNALGQSGLVRGEGAQWVWLLTSWLSGKSDMCSYNDTHPHSFWARSTAEPAAQELSQPFSSVLQWDQIEPPGPYMSRWRKSPW